MQKIVGFLSLLLATQMICGCALFQKGPVGNTAVPEPAKAVELDRYLGRWYEIARYEASFQKGCEGVTADYSLVDGGRIKVINACHRGNLDAPLDSATGEAYVVAHTQNAKLRVSFFWPFFGNYWILDHGDDYDWSIVGEPSGRYLWLLFRSPSPSADLVEQVRGRASHMGYDLGLLRTTLQKEED